MIKTEIIVLAASGLLNILFLQIVRLLLQRIRILENEEKIEQRYKKAPENELIGAVKHQMVVAKPEVEDFEREEKPKPSRVADLEPDLQNEHAGEDIEIDLKQHELPSIEDVLSETDESEPSDVYFQGVSYEDMITALQVVNGKRTSESDQLKAGEVFNLVPAEMLEFAHSNEMYLLKINQLATEYTKSKTKKYVEQNFDIGMFVDVNTPS